jgi:hypothetical protein
MLLKLDHVPVRILGEALKDPVGTPSTDLGVEAGGAQFLSRRLDRVHLEAEMTVEPTGGLLFTLVEEFEKGSVIAGQEYPIKFARSIPELVNHPTSQKVSIETYSPRKLCGPEANMRQPLQHSAPTTKPAAARPLRAIATFGRKTTHNRHAAPLFRAAL